MIIVGSLSIVIIFTPHNKEKNELLYQTKFNDGCDDHLKQRCRDARSNVKNAVELAKVKWVKIIVNDIKLMGMSPKKSWEHIKILTEAH